MKYLIVLLFLVGCTDYMKVSYGDKLTIQDDFYGEICCTTIGFRPDYYDFSCLMKDGSTKNIMYHKSSTSFKRGCNE